MSKAFDVRKIVCARTSVNPGLPVVVGHNGILNYGFSQADYNVFNADATVVHLFISRTDVAGRPVYIYMGVYGASRIRDVPLAQWGNIPIDVSHLF